MKLKISTAILLLSASFFEVGLSLLTYTDISNKDPMDSGLMGIRLARGAKIYNGAHTQQNKYSLTEEKRKGKQSFAMPVLTYQDFDEQLEKLITHLRVFFNETNFDSTAFLKESQNLKEQLFEIQTSIEMAQVNQMLSGKDSVSDRIIPEKSSDLLRFSSHMMHIMKECADELRDTRKKANLIQHLVRSVLQQKVRLLTLIDNRGNPNVQLVGFMQKVDLHAEHLKYWNGLFNHMKNLSFQQRLEFQHQYYQAKSTIGVLQMAAYSSKRWN